MKETVHWINLTNGLLAIPHGIKDFRVMRLQSTHCEQKQWGKVLNSIPDDMLWLLAHGHVCVVRDYGANKNTPRAIWQGLEFARFAIIRSWFGDDVKVSQKYSERGGVSMMTYCERAMLGLPEMGRINYYRDFAIANKTNDIRLLAVTDRTDMDNKKMEVYRMAMESLGGKMETT